MTARPDRTTGHVGPAARRTGARAARALALATATAALLAACSVTNTITTQSDDEVSDGVRVELGQVRAGNVLVVTSAQGGTGTVVGFLTNSGAEDVEVAVGGGDESAATVRVPAGGTVLLGPDHEEVLVGSAEPGATAALTFTVDGGRTATVPAPVLDGTLPDYAGLVPEGD